MGSIIMKNKDVAAEIDGRVVDVASGDKGNSVTYYEYFNLAADGYNIFALQMYLQATTLTLEGSNDKASLSDSAKAWVDLTSVITNGVASNFTADGSIALGAPFLWARIRIKLVTTNSTNSARCILVRGSM